MWWSIGGGIIIFALGMFIFLKPGLIWKLTEEWKSYRADEPSEFYLKTTKIGGILFALFGIIMIILPFILEWQFPVYNTYIFGYGGIGYEICQNLSNNSGP